ncbi:zinc ribbon domain-containing protein [Deinococcus marmoris]|uniref:zinc ribbon domain-containing protein n=1 Tax=Deinococcus marmoris TaxID=249408 RepID=UPI0009DD21D1|nr:zinc ribbon domain-containing protein [Deinococcus marmoris]
MPASTHLRVRHALHPAPAQTAALDNLWHLGQHLWAVLALHARLEATGQPQPMQRVAALAAGPPPTSQVPVRLPRRSTAERRRELEVLARARGWRAHLGSATLDGLVSDFGRTLKSLGPVAPPDAIPLTPPHDFALVLGGLARPVGELHAEIAGVPGLVQAPLFLLPGPAGAAVETWRRTFGGDLTTRRGALEAGLLAGDPEADASYLAHVARYGLIESHLGAVPDHAPATPPAVSLVLAEAAQLHHSDAGGYQISWAFRVTGLTPPSHQDLIALDPGVRSLWTWVSGRHSHGRSPMPLSLLRPWSPAMPGPPTRLLAQPQDLIYARLRRHQLLHRTRLKPVLEAGLARFLQFAAVAVERTDFGGMRCRGEDYPEAADFLGTRLYEQFLCDCARLDPGHRMAVWVPPAWTSVDCSVCGARGAVHYRGRSGRCQTCGQHLDRDHNGARNVYQRGAAQLVARGLPWTPAPLPIPPRRRRP